MRERSSPLRLDTHPAWYVSMMEGSGKCAVLPEIGTKLDFEIVSIPVRWDDPFSFTVKRSEER